MKPTPKMLTVLKDMIEGRGTHHNCHGQSEHGGRTRILGGLYRRGLIDRDYKVTALGKTYILSTSEANRLVSKSR